VSGRTPLTYYGGKQKLAAQIVELMPRHVAYLEPFAGGAAVLFAKPAAERETLNDIDGQIMRFWRTLRDQPEQLASVIAITPYGRADWRESLEPAEDDVEAARRLLVNVDQSFSRSRESWSPPSLLKDRKGRWQPRTWQSLPLRIRVAAERLTNVCLENSDAVDLIPRWDHPETVIYVDPPYTGDHRKTMAKGYAHDADPDLWSRLVTVLGEIESAAVILSGYPCAEVERLGWRTVSLRANSNVQARAGGKLPKVPETLWLSPAVPEPFPDLLTLEPPIQRAVAS
jgi:DNA adenine methylase